MVVLVVTLKSSYPNYTHFKFRCFGLPGLEIVEASVQDYFLQDRVSLDSLHPPSLFLLAGSDFLSKMPGPQRQKAHDLSKRTQTLNRLR